MKTIEGLKKGFIHWCESWRGERPVAEEVWTYFLPLIQTNRQELQASRKELLDKVENCIEKKPEPVAKDMPITNINEARKFYINGGWNCCRNFIKQKITELREGKNA